MKENNNEIRLRIMSALKDREHFTIAGIQKEFNIGFPFAEEIYDAELQRRESENQRVELSAHTHMSPFGGLNHPFDYFEVAQRRGVKAIAITDIGATQSFSAAQFASEHWNVKPIYGCELFLEEGEDINRVHVLAKDKEGLKRLYELVSKARLRCREDHLPCLSLEELFTNRGHILVGLNTFNKSIHGCLKEDKCNECRDLFAHFDYLEVVPEHVSDALLGETSSTEYQEHVRRVISLGKELRIPVVAVGDACYLDNEQEEHAGALDYSRQVDSLYRNANAFPSTRGRRFLSTQEMLDEFAFLGEAEARRIVISEPNAIASQIKDFKPFRNGRKVLPLFEEADERLESLCLERLGGFCLKNGDPVRIRNRLKAELTKIKERGLASIFLTWHQIREKAKEEGHVMRSYGPMANSLVARILGVTDIEEELPMELFFGDELPDVGIASPSHYQGQVHEYMRALFGEENVIRLGAVMPLRFKTSYLRAQYYFDEKEEQVDVSTIEEVANACSIVKRAEGQRPASLIVLPKGHAWNEFTPLQYPFDMKGAWKTSHYSLDELTPPLYAFEFYGSGNLEWLDRLLVATGKCLDDIPIYDQDLISMCLGNETDGLPECGKPCMAEWVRLTKASSFSDLVTLVSLFHGSGAMDYYREQFASGCLNHCDQIISNADDLWNALVKRNMSKKRAFQIVDHVRQGLGLSKEEEALMAASGLSDIDIEACKQARSLPFKSHIIELVKTDIRLAYFKRYYPELFVSIRAELFD